MDTGSGDGVRRRGVWLHTIPWMAADAEGEWDIGCRLPAMAGQYGP